MRLRYAIGFAAFAFGMVCVPAAMGVMALRDAGRVVGTGLKVMIASPARMSIPAPARYTVDTTWYLKGHKVPPHDDPEAAGDIADFEESQKGQNVSRHMLARTN